MKHIDVQRQVGGSNFGLFAIVNLFVLWPLPTLTYVQPVTAVIPYLKVFFKNDTVIPLHMTGTQIHQEIIYLISTKVVPVYCRC